MKTAQNIVLEIEESIKNLTENDKTDYLDYIYGCIEDMLCLKQEDERNKNGKG